MPHHFATASDQNGRLETHGETIHWARFYDLAVNLLALGSEKGLREATINLAAIQPGERILDVGCGTGSLTLKAKEKTGPEGEVRGIDPAAEMIAVARQKAENAGLDIQFLPGVAEELNVPDGYFDLVMSSLVVHHLPGDELKARALAEMFRVLKSGGRLLIVDFRPPTGRLSRWILRPFLKGMLDYDISGIIPLVEKAGFSGVESGQTVHRLASFVRASKPEVL